MSRGIIVASSLLRRAAQRVHCTTPSEFTTARKASSGSWLRQAHVRHDPGTCFMHSCSAIPHYSSLAQQGHRHCLTELDRERNSKRGSLRALLQGPSNMLCSLESCDISCQLVICGERQLALDWWPGDFCERAGLLKPSPYAEGVISCGCRHKKSSGRMTASVPDTKARAILRQPRQLLTPPESASASSSPTRRDTLRLPTAIISASARGQCMFRHTL